MPKESDKSRIWERDRRNRLNEGFLELSKVLPDYDPSIKARKLDILEKSAAYITELQKKINDLINTKISDKPEGDIIKKLQDRVKKLLNRNEQLAVLLQSSGITAPSVFRPVKKAKQTLWSQKIRPEQAKVLQREHEKENVLGKKPRKSSKVASKSAQPQKPKKSNVKKKTARSRKKSGNVLMLSKNFIVLQQPVVSQSCYVVTNPPPTVGVIKTTANTPALTTSTYITTTLVQPPIKPVTTPFKGAASALGPGTLIFPNGATVPVLPQLPQIPQMASIPQIAPIPQIIANPIPLHPPPSNPTLIVLPKAMHQTTPAPTVVTNSTKIKVNNKETKSTVPKSHNMPKILPKICTSTTQINKVPIPALTSRYADMTFTSESKLINRNDKKVSSDLTASKSTSKSDPAKEKLIDTKLQKKPLGNKPSNKRTIDETESPIPAKVAKVQNKNTEPQKNTGESSQEDQPLATLIDSVCVENTNNKVEKGIENNTSDVRIDQELGASSTVTDSCPKEVPTQEAKPGSKDALIIKESVDTLKENKNDNQKEPNPNAEMLQTSSNSDLHVNLNQKTLNTDDKIEQDKPSEKQSGNIDIAQAQDILNEKLSETITQLVPSMPTTAAVVYGSDTNYDKVEESNIVKDVQETTEKPDDIATDIKTLEMDLGHSELSNDIFASLQVPAGCQNPESTSPTAAFLLAFPLVSSLTGVKVTEVMDEENTESQSGTPTLLQIGTMDSTKPTQSQSDSLTPSLLNLDNLSFFNTKDICSSFYTPFDNIPVSSGVSSNIVASTTTATSMLPPCQSSKIVTQKHHANAVAGNEVPRKHGHLVNQPIKHNTPVLPVEKANCASSSNESKSISTTNSNVCTINRENIATVNNKTPFNVSVNKIPYPAKVPDINNVHLSNRSGNTNSGTKIVNNENTREVLNREVSHSFSNINMVNNSNGAFTSNLYERNNVHIPPYERSDTLMSTGNLAMPSINTSLPASTVMHTSKTAVLPTNVLSDNVSHNVQGPYQQSKQKNDSFVRNGELKLCMTFSQNVQQNKSFNNTHYTGFPSLDTDKILNTTCVYNQISKSLMDPIYTNSNTYNNYNVDQNNSYYKKCENRNYYNTNYQNYEDCRKNENTTQFTNNYYHHSQSYNVKDKYINNTGNATNKNQQNTVQGIPNPAATNQVRPPINWMTTPDNRQTTTDYVMPMFSKDNTFTSSSNYPSNSFIVSNQTTYFNSNPVYSNSDIMSDTRKPLDLPLVSVNSYQRTDADDNQFPWSPTKLPQFLEPPTFVSSTLTNLIGDLALGNPNTFLDQKCDTKFSRDTAKHKENVKRTKPNTTYETQSNFLSVSQLVEHNKSEASPARVTNRRNSATNRSTAKNSQNKVKRNAKIQDTKDINQQFAHHKNVEHNSASKSNQIKPFNVQGNEMFCAGNVASNVNSNNTNNNHSSNNTNTSMNQPNKNRNINKNVPSSYSAEALIGHQSHQIPTDKSLNMQQNYTPTTKASLPVPSFLPENIISYFPPVDIQQDNTFNQNQNYQPTSFSHNFTTSFQNNSYNNNFMPPVSTITNNYLSTNNFMHDMSSHDYLSDNLSLFPPSKDTKHYNKNSKNNANTTGSNREEKPVQSSTSCSNYKKTKRKQVTESATVPNFVDFAFLSVPGAINSPILPDDFHSHSSFLAPPTPSQLYPCKNPLYPKQSADLATGPLLPLPPPVPVTRSSIQHPEISPSLNTGGTSLTNFNLSTIFPEINKSPLNGGYTESKAKDHTPRSYTTSGSQVSFNNKSTFSLSYINCPTTQYNQ